MSTKLKCMGLVLLLGALLAPSMASASPESQQYVRLGSQMLVQKNYNEAYKYFNLAVKMDNKSAAAYKGLGYSMIGRGEKSKALPYLRYSAQLNPDDAVLRQYLQAQGVGLPPAAAALPNIQTSPVPTTQAQAAPADTSKPWIVGGTAVALGAILLFIF